MTSTAVRPEVPPVLAEVAKVLSAVPSVVGWVAPVFAEVPQVLGGVPLVVDGRSLGGGCEWTALAGV